MSFTLTQIALVIASIILLIAILSMLTHNDWQQQAELQNMATKFTTLTESIHTHFLENITTFVFPEKSYYYFISLTSEHIQITTTGAQHSTLSITQQFLVTLWPWTPEQPWKTGTELHEYCLTTYGHTGKSSDPITSTNFQNLTKLNNQSCYILAVQPYSIVINEPLFIEKTIIFYGESEKQEYILIYQ